MHAQLHTQVAGLHHHELASCSAGSPFVHHLPAWAPLSAALQPQPSAPAALQASALQIPQGQSTHDAHAPAHLTAPMRCVPALPLQQQQQQPQQAAQQFDGLFMPELGEGLAQGPHDTQLSGLLDNEDAWSSELLDGGFYEYLST